MKKRILTVLLAVCLVFALGTVSALAADGEQGDASQTTSGGVAQIVGGSTYNTLQAAINEAGTTATTITLLKDTTENIEIKVGANITINGGGNTINGNIKCDADRSDDEGDYSSITLVLNNLTLNGQTDETTYAQYGISSQNQNVTDDNLVNLYLTLNNCTIQNFSKKGLYLTNAKTLTVNGCTFNQNATANPDSPNTYGDYTLDLNLCGVKNSKISITNSTFTDFGSYAAIKVTARGLNDGTWANDIKGNQATIDSLVIEDCTFTSNNNNVADVRLGTDFKGDRKDDSGNLVTGMPTSGSVESNITGKFDVSITSNTDPVKVDLAYLKTEKGDTTEPKQITVPANTTYTKTPTGDFGESGTFEARVNGQDYATLQAAIDAAAPGDTVTLLKNVTVNVPEGTPDTTRTGAINIDKSITLNGGGYTIQPGDTFTTAPESNGHQLGNFHLINITGGNVTIRNLNIDGNDKARAGINIFTSNSATSKTTVSVDDVDIFDCTAYGIIVGGSNVTVEDVTTSGNDWGGINVDHTDSSAAGATLTVKSGTTLNESNSIRFENSKKDTTAISATIQGGTINGLINVDNANTSISVTGGSFKQSMKAYVNPTSLPYEAVTAGGTYSYHTTASGALSAAGQGGEVNYLGNPNNACEVTLYYDKYVQTELIIAYGDSIKLPGGTFEGKQIEGWKYGSEVFKPGETDKITSDRTYYVILRNGQFDIVIDDNIKHGDVTTDVSSANRGDTVYIYVDPDTGYVLDDLNVYYGTNNRYSVTVSYVRAGVYKFTMPNASVYITATFKYAALPFTDVNRNQWFYDEVFYVYTNGMMEGDSATTFNPDGQMTRAMFWAVLGRIDGANITGANWVDEARSWAMRKGVSDGTNPNDYVTREQMVTMLWRYAGEKNGTAYLGGYTDSGKISSYAVEAMRWAIGNGIIEGMTSTTLVPQGTATRAQCAAIFMRFDQM